MLRVWWKFAAQLHSRNKVQTQKRKWLMSGEARSTRPSIKGSTWRSGRCNVFTSRKAVNPIPQLHEHMNFTKPRTFQSISFAFWQHLSQKLDFRNLWLQARSPHELYAAAQNPPFQVALGRDHGRNDQHSLERANLIPKGSELTRGKVNSGGVLLWTFCCQVSLSNCLGPCEKAHANDPRLSAANLSGPSWTDGLTKILIFGRRALEKVRFV